MEFVLYKTVLMRFDQDELNCLVYKVNIKKKINIFLCPNNDVFHG